MLPGRTTRGSAFPSQCGSIVGGHAQLSFAESCTKCADMAGFREINPETDMIGSKPIMKQARGDATLLEPVSDLR